MANYNSLDDEKSRRRTLGTHMTSIDIFSEFIYPEVKEKLQCYIWVDLYAGEGNLILPLLNAIDIEKREDFFREHIYLFDIQKKMVTNCIKNAKEYGISESIARNNIQVRDNLESFPDFLKMLNKPIFHITNPPYLYLGYISKHESTKNLMKYFTSDNFGYQDLYQIAMMNDLRNDLNNLIYILPTNFLFGASVSNKFRINFLKYYNIWKMIIFERKMFRFTGTNICIGFFQKKSKAQHEINAFNGIKIRPNGEVSKRRYVLTPKFKYRAGSEFNAFLKKFKAVNPLKVTYYLLAEEVNENLGENEVTLMDANQYINGEYTRIKCSVNEKLYNKIDRNILYVRTVDTGKNNGRVGLNIIKEDLNADGILVSGNTYRTHPIHIFLKPEISIEKQIILKKYFNFLLEYFRAKLDSDFLTTYKYSNASYIRKYLGLNQVRSLINTFPFNMNVTEELELNKIIDDTQFPKILHFLEKLRS
jgi:hypothetical protein